MPGDPADVGGAPVNVFLFEVEHPVGGERRTYHVAAGRMEDPFGFACGAGRVEDVEWVLGIYMLGVDDGILGYGGHLLVPPHVSALLHLDDLHPLVDAV